MRLRALAFVLIAALLPVAVGAQSSTNAQSFTAAGVDASPTFTGGFNTCSLQISGTWSGFTVVAKGSSDNGLTYPTTIATIGGGSITANGNYAGSIAGLALTNFEYVVSGASPTGTITITKTCNTQPTGATASPGGYPAMQRILYGNGATYVDSAIDEFTYTAAIQSATTTQVLAGVAGQYTFLANAFVYLGSTNSNAYVYLEEGTGATCGTNTKNITQYLAVGTANGTQTAIFPPLFGPIVIPQGYNICAVTAGTTIYLIVEAFYTQHS